MNINLIADYALRNKFYAELIEGDYIIPLNLIKKNGNSLSLSNNRKKALLENESSYSRLFELDIDNRNLLFIKEFPIIIENRQLWSDILDYFGEKNKKFRDSNYFLLDFYFPFLRLNVEIDSEYHKSKQTYDKSRDTYLKQIFGIDTFRFYEYGKDDEHRLPYLKRFNKYVNNLLDYSRINNLYDSKLQISFSTIIVNNFIRDNKAALEFIDKIINYVGEYKFYSYNNVRLSRDDLLKIDNTFNVNNLDDKMSLERLFIDNIVNLMMDIFRIRLLI